MADWHQIGTQVEHDCQILQTCIDELMQAWNCDPIGHRYVAANRSRIEFAFMALAGLTASINKASTTPTNHRGAGTNADQQCISK